MLERLKWVVSLAWLTGPIFDKELRVSSRRRRNYVLRFFYVGLFTFLLVVVWLEQVSHGTSSLYQSSRMARVGLFLIAVVVWFQFIATQVTAIVMLSTSISDEIYNRTLGLLMTTPIGSFQIVFGKLLSKLLQLILLLAITLPLLAIVRVFGGVPWNYLLCSLCVTLTTVIFVASLSLFLSIFTRRAYTVIITTVTILALLFAVLPLVAAFLTFRTVPGGTFFTIFAHVNPYILLFLATDALQSARAIGSAIWLVHCGIALGASASLLFLAMVLVRKAALRQAAGQRGLWSRVGRAGSFEDATRCAHAHRVLGPPVFWKESRTPLLGKRKATMIVAIVLILGLLGLTYYLCARERLLAQDGTHVGYAVVLLFFGLLFTTVLPATCITSEKESRTWPLLLTTTLGNWQIVWGKFLGVVRRCLPAWVPLFGHVVVFTLAGIIHPVALVQLGILVTWIVLFLSGSGLYFGTRFRHTTTAVIANMGLAVGLWALFPLLLGITVMAADAGVGMMDVYMDMNPLVQAVVITMATARNGDLAAYEWIQGGLAGLTETSAWILFNWILYAGAGLAFAARAACRLRRNPF